MIAPITPRRRESDHPRRRLEDQPAHRRLLRLVVIGVVVGAITVLLALTELRYRTTARAEDVAELRDLTEQLADIEARAGRDVREHRVRTEEYLGRLCAILVASHDGVTPSDCPTPLVHPSDPARPADDD